MKRKKPEGAVHPDTLLDLWLGEAPGAERQGVRRRLPLAVTLPLALVAFLGVILLLKFAVDVLAIIVALVVVGLLLHVLALRLADSEVVSPVALLLIVLAVGVLGYVFLVPNDPGDALSKHTPRWLVSAVGWSQQRGWARTVWLELPTSEGPQISPLGPTGDGRPPGLGSSLSATTPLPLLVVTASAPAIRAGQRVTVMARAAGSETAVPDGSARFYDGSTLLARVPFERVGGTRIASLVVGNLSVGKHDIRAQFVSALGRTGPSSSPFLVTVAPR